MGSRERGAGAGVCWKAGEGSGRLRVEGAWSVLHCSGSEYRVLARLALTGLVVLPVPRPLLLLVVLAHC